MILTNNNILVTKYASKWVLNLLNEKTNVDEDFIGCMFYIIGDHKNLMNQIVNNTILYHLHKTYGDDLEYDLDELLSKSHVLVQQENIFNIIEKYPLCKDIIRYEYGEVLRENTKIYTGPLKSYEIYSRIYIPDLSDIDRELWLLFYTIKNHPKIKKFIFSNSKIEEDQIYIGKLLDVDRNTLMNSLSKFLVYELFDYKNGKLSVSELFKDI